MSKSKTAKALQAPAAMAVLTAIHEPSFTAHLLPEPRLIFGGGSQECEPKAGLALFGPHDSDAPGHRSTMRLGIIGTPAMVDAARAWVDRCRDKIRATRLKREKGAIVRVPMDPITSPFFPGVQQVFRTDFQILDDAVQTILPREVATIEGIKLFEPRITALIRLVADRLKVIAEGMTPPDLVIVALPTALRVLCTVPSRHKRRAKRPQTLADQLRKALQMEAAVGQLSLIDVAALHNVSVESGGPDSEHAVLHHGLKARAMEHGIPIQLAWQTTFEGGPNVEDDATRAWNFWTGAYYKAGGIPWRVTGLEPGACYVGLSFYKSRTDDSMRTCMAQAFSDQGEGVVLRSEPFKWQTGWNSRSPHLPKELASELMQRVLAAYERVHQQPPRRVVVHKWQRYDEGELAGFLETIDPSKRSYDLVALGSRDIRFFRAGMEPPLRGTMIALTPTNSLLYTRGYVPYLGTYPGMRIPRPLELTEHHGTSSPTTVCREILALTKLDWNTATFAGKEPITTAFSEDVGQILAELPPGAAVRPQYRFYM